MWTVRGGWRTYHFIEDTVTYDKVESKEDFYNSARAFGRFQQLLSDYPAETLHETIPNFHNTVDRFAKFREALNRDICGRAKMYPGNCLCFRAGKGAPQADRLAEIGKTALRVTHNDTKLNNVLIDKETGEGICVIDLDTVMPACPYTIMGIQPLWRYLWAEDEQDLSKVNFELELFEAYTKGWLEVAGDVLTPYEIENLPMGAKLMTLECGIRFLTDYLSGDTYFKVHREEHNLDLVPPSFKLVSDMEACWGEMKAIVKYTDK